jgi:hypothetical protein
MAPHRQGSGASAEQRPARHAPFDERRRTDDRCGASGPRLHATVRAAIVSRCGSWAGTHVAWSRSAGR